MIALAMYKVYRRENRYNETLLKPTYFASPLALHHIEVPAKEAWKLDVQAKYNK